jgi:hypothetical protein
MKFLKIGDKIINTNKITEISINKSNLDSKFRIVVLFEGYDNSGSTKLENMLYLQRKYRNFRRSKKRIKYAS